jgi:hypothetical protein
MNFMIMGTQLVNNFAVVWGRQIEWGTQRSSSSHLCVFSKGHSLVGQFSEMKLIDDPFAGLHTRV